MMNLQKGKPYFVQFLITFLEGVMSFVSPCMLPMLPVYVSYFAGDRGEKKRVFFHALFFVLGFTSIFCLLGVFAGTIGVFLQRYRRTVDIVSGCIVILFGLRYLEVIRLPFFKGLSSGRAVNGVVSAFLFGVVYSLSLTPCVGPFLGSAVMLASHADTVWTGLLLLLTYSVGLGLPFILSAVLIDRLRGAFSWVKRHYRTIDWICGGFLILVGVMMAFGCLDRLMRMMM